MMSLVRINKRAATCYLEQCGILTSADPDMPIQPSFKFRASKLCSVSGIRVIECSSD